jgi:hypothetical protein
VRMLVVHMEPRLRATGWMLQSEPAAYLFARAGWTKTLKNETPANLNISEEEPGHWELVAGGEPIVGAASGCETVTPTGELGHPYRPVSASRAASVYRVQRVAVASISILSCGKASRATPRRVEAGRLSPKNSEASGPSTLTNSSTSVV